MKNKKMMFIFVLICIIIFMIFYYIFSQSGNNIIINQNEFVEDILKRLEYYEANIDVIVKSNKNENTYNMQQTITANNSKVIVNSPENIKGLVIEIKNDTLKVINNKINMEKIYENYKTIINNSLFLNSFIEDYKNNEAKIYENNEEIIIEIKLDKNQNTYIKSKELYIDKAKKIPKKLIIKDNTQNINTSIIYNDIKIK